MHPGRHPGQPPVRQAGRRRHTPPPAETASHDKQGEQAQRLVQVVGGTAFGTFGQIDHGPAQPEQPEDQTGLSPVQEHGRQAVAFIVHRMATPHGTSPTSMSFSTEKLAVSITDTVPERPLATYSFSPPAVSAIFQGRLPTATVPLTGCVATSMAMTEPSRPLETKTRLPSGCTAILFGYCPTGISATTRCVRVSTA